MFRFLGAFCDGLVWFINHDDRMWRSRHGVLVTLGHKVCERVDRMGLSWLLERSSFGPVRPFVDVARSPEVDWTGLSWLDTLFPYRWETGEVFKLTEGHTTGSQRLPHDGDATLVLRILPACTVRYAVSRLASMDEARERLGCDGALCLAPDAASGDSCDTELTPNLDDDDRDNWGFAYVLVSFHADVCASLRQDWDTIPELASSTKFPYLRTVTASFVLCCRS